MVNLFRYALFVFLFALSSCQTRETEIVILSLNDLHAKIDNLDKVAAYVAEQREQHPNVLLLSAGDLFSGNPAVDIYHDKGYPIIDLMNDIYFDVSAIGNHEFDYGQSVLGNRITQAAFPFVCANINIDSSQLVPFKPYILSTKSGEKICIVGIIQEKPETHADKIKRLYFTNPIDEFEKYLPLRKKSNVLIALTHMGTGQDSLLALRYGEIDLIVGGHSHTKLDTGFIANGVLVTQADKYVRHIGHTTLMLRNGKVVSKRNHLVNVNSLTQQDTMLTRKIEEYNSNPMLHQALTTLTSPIEGDINIGNFFCDAIRSIAKTDIAFQNKYGVRIDKLHKGAVTVGELYRADPFGNEVIKFSWTGKELLQFIADNYNTFQRVDLSTSGMTYKLLVEHDSLTAVSAWINGKAVDLNKQYAVAMNSYMATAYTLPSSDRGTGTELSTVEMTMQYLKGKKAVSYTSPMRGSIEIK